MYYQNPHFQFLETMAEVVKQGIEKAAQDLEKENQEKLQQEVRIEAWSVPQTVDTDAAMVSKFLHFNFTNPMFGRYCISNQCTVLNPILLTYLHFK